MNRRLGFAFASLVALGGCAQVLDFDHVYELTGGAGGGSGSSVAASGQGGSVDVPCLKNGACNDMNPCTSDACNESTGKCAFTSLADGPLLEVPGPPDDCKKSVCEGGALKEVADDSETPPDDMNLCTTQACVGGAVTTTNVPQDTSCGPEPLRCDGMGLCVGCTSAFQCPNVSQCQIKKCSMMLCAPENKPAGDNCNDGVCDGAGACIECVTDDDCDKGKNVVCNAAHACVMSCPDGVKNGVETDVDCGGDGCPNCADGKACMSGNDCASDMCSAGVCQAGPCNADSIKNGQEDDVDCGGACGAGAKCADGKTCDANNDCTSNRCTGAVCTSCADGIKNGAEDDVDCGNICPTKCALGKMCNAGADCVTNTCAMNVCVTSCSDAVKNGSETDVDCGGGVCPKCVSGKSCLVSADCQSGFCFNTKCF